MVMLNLVTRLLIHRSTSRPHLEATRNAIVLLKNENGLLPLDASKYKKVLVTGINANDQNIMGDWSEVQPEDKVSTVFERSPFDRAQY